MRQFSFAAGIVLAVLGGAPPVAADEPGVKLTATYVVVPLDTGFHVVALCNASADPGEPGDVALVTTVTCSLGGFTTRQAMPGHESFARAGIVATTPPTLCVSGQAGFVRATVPDVVVASAEPECTVVPLGS